MRLFAIVLLAVSASAPAQETFKCNVNGSMVYQDRPCPGAARRSASMPEKVAVKDSATESPAPKSEAQARLERDKEYLAEGAYNRQRTEAADRVKACESESYSLQAAIDAEASRQNYYRGDSLRGIAAMQLDEERRQSAMAGLQSRVTAKRHECEELKKDAEKYKQPYKSKK